MDKIFKLNMEKHLPLKEVVFRVLREAIIQGELAPGSRLLEIQLADQLGVSRTPIREAIQMLRDDGLVEVIPRKGAVVAGITEKQMKDVLEVRIAMEELAIRLCAARISSDKLTELERAEKAFEESIKSGDVNESAICDEKFHSIISESTGNKSLVMLLSAFREQMYRFRVAYLMQKEVHEVLISEHNQMIDMIRKGDRDAAAKILRKHIDGQQEMVLEMVKNEKTLKSK